jgi:hypothetical protein
MVRSKLPNAMPSRGIEPESVYFDKKSAKKSNEKVKSRIMLYQLSYAA